VARSSNEIGARDLGTVEAIETIRWKAQPNLLWARVHTSAGAIGSAIAQQHLKTVLANQGLHIVGGEAYILFKPDLVDAQGNVTDDSTRAFLKTFIDRFSAFAARFAPERANVAA